MPRTRSVLLHHRAVSVLPLVVVTVLAAAVRFSTIGPLALRWGWALLAVPLVGLLAIRHLPRSGIRAVGLLAAWLVWAGISLWRSPDPTLGLWLMAAVGTGLLAFLWGAGAGDDYDPPRQPYPAAVALILLFAALFVLPEPHSVGQLNPDRILAMGATVALVLAWKPPVSRLWVATTGLGAVIIGIASGSRTASLVLILLALTAPGLRMPHKGRLLVGSVVVVLLVGAAATPAFQERWFVSDPSNVSDVVTLDNLQTSGRAEGWSAILARCDAPVIGDGVGASAKYGREFSPGFPEPHDEYLRIGCDTGIVGWLLFWGFIALVGRRAQTALRRTGPGDRWRHVAALQLLFAFVVLSLTDNPITTSVFFPVASWVWGMSAAGTVPRGRVGSSM